MKSKVDELSARLIRNTIKKNTQRADNLLVIARDVEELIRLTGSINAAAKHIDLSLIMLKKFLSVNNLSEEVKKLVEQRKFDNVQAAYDIRSLSSEEQLIIAKSVSERKISGSDVKNLIPQKNKDKNVPIEDIIDRLVALKDVKIYSAFIILEKPKTKRQVEEILVKELDKKLIHSITLTDNVIKISFTKEGYESLKTKAKSKNYKLKEYLNYLINGQ